MSFVIKYQAVSDVGCMRQNNEDMAYAAGKLVRDSMECGETPIDGCSAFAVADGMGGYEGGEVASEIVCRSFRIFVKNNDGKIGIQQLKKWAVEANNLVLETARLRQELAEMGSTFVALLFNEAKLWMVNVGDSRCYRVRNGVLKQLSTDHSESERTGNADVPSNLIYNFMGNAPELFFSDVTELTPLPGDIYLLCSDGLSDMVEADEIEALASDPVNLTGKAKQAGGRDNITVISIEYEKANSEHRTADRPAD